MTSVHTQREESRSSLKTAIKINFQLKDFLTRRRKLI